MEMSSPFGCTIKCNRATDVSQETQANADPAKPREAAESEVGTAALPGAGEIGRSGGRGRESNPRRTARQPHLALKASRITGCVPLPRHLPSCSYSAGPPEVKVRPASCW